MQWREGTVVEETARWSGAVEFAVDVADGVGPAPGERGSGAGPAGIPRGTARDAGPASRVRALAYPAVTGEPRPGDRVLLNTAALARGLGTGGLAFVVAVPDRLPPDPAARPGHIVKGRYTPQQQMLLAVDEQESAHHALLADADDLAAMPVVVADLHSALPAVVAGVRAERPGVRVAYVMTDGGALPAAFSRAVSGLREAGWVAATVTTGQAYGGDLEAVTVHTGLLAARLVVGADVAVVAQGPGNVGTGTRWGFSGVAAGEAVNAAAALGGRPVAALRVSGGDARARHRGVSHHSLTAYGRVALAPADVPVPVLPDTLADLPGLVSEQAADLVAASDGRLRRVDVEVDGLDEALRGSPVRLSTMGRGLEADPAAFLASAAAGRLAARLLEAPDPSP